MANKGTKNKKINLIVGASFAFLSFLMALNPGFHIPVLGGLIRLPLKLYVYVIYTLFCFLGGYVFQRIFFKQAHLSVPNAMKSLLTAFSVLVFLFIIFSLYLYIQDSTALGKLIRVPIAREVRDVMERLMGYRVPIFIGGIFFYHSV